MRWVYSAYAKINWTLDVLGRRSDGYHDLEMLMQSVSLHDTLHIEPARAFSLEILGTRQPLVGENLVLRAARALRQATGEKRAARFTLVKRIPVSAGLGGGSADAAATLVGLNQIWKLGLPKAELERIAVGVGADIPFCLTGGLALAHGVGEKLRFHVGAPERALVLVKPCAGVSTKDVFGALNVERIPRGDRPDTDRALEALLSGDDAALAAAMGNALTHVTLPMRGEIARALEALREAGAKAVSMSGSGPTVYGLFGDMAEAKAVRERISARYPDAWYAGTVAAGVEMRGGARPAMR